MLDITEALVDNVDNRKMCAAIAARLIDQGRHPEIVPTKTRTGKQRMKLIDHSQPIYAGAYKEKRIIGFEC